jgi:hypothetical protein
MHEAVRNALVKDGWTITAAPYVIQFETVRTYADLEAEAPVVVENNGRRILVEVKSVTDASAIHAFEEALGQYQFYRYLIALTGSGHEVYLAVSEDVYHSILERDGLREIVALSQMAILVVNIARAEIVRWIA